LCLHFIVFYSGSVDHWFEAFSKTIIGFCELVSKHCFLVYSTNLILSFFTQFNIFSNFPCDFFLLHLWVILEYIFLISRLNSRDFYKFSNF
jgi:hypothetical protein